MEQPQPGTAADTVAESSSAAQRPANGSPDPSISPRRPAGMPQTVSLAERIAALQRKSSGSGTRSASGPSGLPPRSDGSSTSAHLMRAASLNHTTNGAGDASDQKLSVPPPISNAHLKNSAAVKDRIARFQTPDKPLLPRSSFGTPAPMQKETRALRAYPGAAVGSSGAWGEGVLRPQMTGGTFFEGRNVHELRPQLTGSPWTGTGGRTPPPPSSFRGSPSPNNSLMQSRSPINNRDAFQELDEDAIEAGAAASPSRIRPLRRGSSFTEAQMAAASMGLRASRAASNDGTAESVATSSVHTDQREDGESDATTLPDLPSAPSKELPGAAQGEPAARPQEGSVLPSVPKTSPTMRRDTSFKRDNDVEIGVSGASPQRLAQMQRKISHGERRAASDADVLNGLGAAPKPPTELLAEIRSRSSDQMSSKRLDSTEQITDINAAAEMERLKLAGGDVSISSPRSPTSRDGHSEALASPPPTKPDSSMSSMQRSPSSTSLAKQPSSPVRTRGMNSSTSTDRMLTSSADRKAPSVQSPTSPTGMKTSTSTSSLSSAASQDAVQRAKAAISAARARNATGSSSGHATGASEPIAEASTTTEQSLTAPKPDSTISNGRVSSRGLRTPEPGRVMSVAEMDASDDEYEPGWASVTKVLSSSRVR